MFLFKTSQSDEIILIWVQINTSHKGCSAPLIVSGASGYYSWWSHVRVEFPACLFNSDDGYSDSFVEVDLRLIQRWRWGDFVCQSNSEARTMTLLLFGFIVNGDRVADLVLAGRRSCLIESWHKLNDFDKQSFHSSKTPKLILLPASQMWKMSTCLHFRAQRLEKIV